MKNLKKRIGSLLMAMVMLVSCISVGNIVSANAKKDATDAYDTYLATIKKANPKKHIYYAKVNAGKNGTPVLLITKGVFKDGGNLAVSADVYNYTSEEVTYVATVTSCGTSYPICNKGKYILTGEHHTSTRTTISGAKAYSDSVEGVCMGEKYDKCKIKRLVTTAGKTKTLSSKKISQNKAEKINYYSTNGNYSGKTVKFKEYK